MRSSPAPVRRAAAGALLAPPRAVWDRAAGMLPARVRVRNPADKVEKLIRKPGFTGQAPGGPSRWSTARSSEWQPLAPKLVVEVQYDHFSGGRFRHGTSFLRWRPDKPPRDCTYAQLEVVPPQELAEIFATRG